jgi:hypothetical protein
VRLHGQERTSCHDRAQESAMYSYISRRVKAPDAAEEGQGAEAVVAAE